MGTGTTWDGLIDKVTDATIHHIDPSLANHSPRKRIILLNGPPGVGKDTLGTILSEECGLGTLCSFKTPLFKIALDVSGVSRIEWDTRYENRKLKETPWDKLNGMTQREFLIKISEEWVKPTFGEDYFGQAASLQAANVDGDCIFTDSGFPLEVEPFKVAGYEVVLFRLYRKGYNFHGDSRDYLFGVADEEWDIVLTDDQPNKAAAEIVRLL